MPITDQQVEAAADWLRDNAPEAGRLRGARVYCEEYRKSLKAILTVQSLAKSAADREAHAYAHEKYLAHLLELRDAVAADEENRALREAAALKVEVWRTEGANNRGRI